MAAPLPTTTTQRGAISARQTLDELPVLTTKRVHSEQPAPDPLTQMPSSDEDASDDDPAARTKPVPTPKTPPEHPDEPPDGYRPA